MFTFPFMLLSPATQTTIYGKRDGALQGLAVVSGLDRTNFLKQSRGWKQGVIHGVSMLQRSEMWKPDNVPRTSLLYHTHGRSNNIYYIYHIYTYITFYITLNR